MNEEFYANPCEGCGGTEMPLHTDNMCPNCHKLDAEVDDPDHQYGPGVPVTELIERFARVCHVGVQAIHMQESEQFVPSPNGWFTMPSYATIAPR